MCTAETIRNETLAPRNPLRAQTCQQLVPGDVLMIVNEPLSFTAFTLHWYKSIVFGGVTPDLHQRDIKIRPSDFIGSIHGGKHYRPDPKFIELNGIIFIGFSEFCN